MKALFLKDVSRDSSSGATQRLYRLDPPLKPCGASADEPGYVYVVVLAVITPYSGAETYIFPADEEGNITSFLELPGSYGGGLDHDNALKYSGYLVAYTKPLRG